MSQNINEQGWRILAIVIVAVALAFTGGLIMGEKHQAQPAAAAQPGVHYEIKQYTGVGSGVLKSGTLLDLTGKDSYTEPGDIVGHIDAPGTWYIVRSEASSE